MNTCKNCGKAGIKNLYCDRNCRYAYHSRQHSRRKGILSREETIANLGDIVCAYPLCLGVFKPHTFGQMYCSESCRDKEALRVRPIKTFEQKLKWNHKLPLDEYNVLLFQGCALCGKPFGTERNLIPCIDHDHNCCKKGTSCAKCRRGIIHSQCNLIIGHADDDADLLMLAASYLERFQ